MGTARGCDVVRMATADEMELMSMNEEEYSVSDVSVPAIVSPLGIQRWNYMLECARSTSISYSPWNVMFLPRGWTFFSIAITSLFYGLQSILLTVVWVWTSMNSGVFLVDGLLRGYRFEPRYEVMQWSVLVAVSGFVALLNAIALTQMLYQGLQHKRLTACMIKTNEVRANKFFNLRASATSIAGLRVNMDAILKYCHTKAEATVMLFSPCWWRRYYVLPLILVGKELFIWSLYTATVSTTYRWNGFVIMLFWLYQAIQSVIYIAVLGGLACILLFNGTLCACVQCSKMFSCLGCENAC